MIECQQLRGRFVGGRLVHYLTDRGIFLAWTMLIDMGAGEREAQLCTRDEHVMSLVQVLSDDGVCARVSVTPLTLHPHIGFLAHRIIFGHKAAERAAGPSDAAQAIVGATA